MKHDWQLFKGVWKWYVVNQQIGFWEGFPEWEQAADLLCLLTTGWHRTESGRFFYGNTKTGETPQNLV